MLVQHSFILFDEGEFYNMVEKSSIWVKALVTELRRNIWQKSTGPLSTCDVQRRFDVISHGSTL